jgi:hypothetical protein
MAGAGARGGGKRPATAREKARAFALEGLPEQDRFGVFDPALRGFFVLAIMFAVVFGGGWTLEAARGSSAGVAAAAALAAALAVAGASGYRRIWRKPAEREMVLAMAKEDDESREALARRARAAAAAKRSPPDGEPNHD